MEDLIKKLRFLTIQDTKYKEKANEYLKSIEGEISYALILLYGKIKSKFIVNEDVGLIFKFDNTDILLSDEGFVFDATIEKDIIKLSDSEGKLFWEGLESVKLWIPKLIEEIEAEEKTKLALISDLEMLTESTKSYDDSESQVEFEMN